MLKIPKIIKILIYIKRYILFYLVNLLLNLAYIKNNLIFANFVLQIYIGLMMILPVTAWNTTKYSTWDILIGCFVVIFFIIIFAFLFVVIVYGSILLFVYFENKQQHQTTPNVIKNKISTEEERLEGTQSTLEVFNDFLFFYYFSIM